MSNVCSRIVVRVIIHQSKHTFFLLFGIGIPNFFSLFVQYTTNIMAVWFCASFNDIIAPHVFMVGLCLLSEELQVTVKQERNKICAINLQKLFNALKFFHSLRQN